MSRVFLSGSVRGGRRLAETYRFMADVMLISRCGGYKRTYSLKDSVW